ncbi:CoA transferase [Longimicrobium sp.]|uniref:CoA transferase n=1 Tax=Longimicrobium sp. TaxID=2029185 RepID=UPI002E313580|nr:CoA transferase [Longimicrobium sp.]HEX6042037.1 CoA transferase [Longimicrobium sp.]
MDAGVPPLLDGWVLATRGDPALPVRVCAEHLALLGARWGPAEGGAGEADALSLRPERGPAAGPPIACALPWIPGGDDGGEVRVQALSGLMAVHGRDGGVPRRLGLEAASVAAGIVAAQGVLAAVYAAGRGRPVRRVHASVLHAALLLLSHHVVLATTPDRLAPGPPADGPGPPFPTADGHRVEIEALGFGPWIGFWRRLGVEREGLEAAWSSFVHRYLAASCTLPAALHRAMARHSLAELRQAGDACGVAVCRVRAYPELIAELGGANGIRPPWRIQPSPGGTRAVPPRPAPPAGAPLEGIRVVEVTSRLQGPLAGLLLRMLGAEVVKVEPPGGDFGRHSPPLAGPLGAAYLAYNRGKRVVEIDYKQPEGRARLAELAAGADVFLHNWRGGRARELGLDSADLAPRSPGLVYAHASGWGPGADEPCAVAGDFLVQAHAACGDGLNPADEPPFPARLTLLDPLGGLLACEGVLAGLCLRARTGRGCRVDTSLWGGAMALQGHVLRAMVFDQERGRRTGRPVWGPLDRPLRAADGWMTVEADDAGARTRLAAACGLPPDADDAALLDRLGTRTAAEWAPVLRAAGVPATPVAPSLADVAADPRTAGMLERIEDACWTASAPWRLEE